MDDRYSIRFATEKDAEIIAAHRRKMFDDMQQGYDAELLKQVELHFAEWVVSRLQIREYVGWLMVDENQNVIAGAGIWVRQRFPHPRNLTGQEGYIGNVYTEPEHRGKGYARLLMETVLAWCRERQLPAVTLHASEFGKSLYESLDFDYETNVMTLRLIDSSKQMD